jgi:hypothetical protein
MTIESKEAANKERELLIKIKMAALKDQEVIIQ